ncbi:MAG: HAD family hydrolase [Polyangiaceae bacterium]
MSEGSDLSPEVRLPAREGEAGTVPCATCGRRVDPLRADRVAIFAERFRYFCSGACRDGYDPTRATPLPAPRPRPRPATPVPAEPTAVASGLQTAVALDRIARNELPSSEPLEETQADAPPAVAADRPEEAGTLLLSLAAVGGVLTVALTLTGSSAAALTSRLIVAAVSTLALGAHVITTPRDATQPHPTAVLAAPAAALALAVIALIAEPKDTTSALTLCGVVVAVSGASILLAARMRRPLDVERKSLEALLDGSAHRVIGDDVVETRALDLRPGEEVVVEPGEVVPVDATITAGSATVAPWWGARTTTTRTEGDTVVATARVIEGRLRAVVAWAGFDRAFLRLTSDPRRRADLTAPLARAGKLLVERAAPVAAGLAALAAYAEAQSTMAIAMFAIAAQAALANAVIAQVGACAVMEAVLASLRRGIVFRTSQAFDEAGRVGVAAFCARGTLLLGEPEVTNIELPADEDAERVLALMAGAEAGSSHPVATAIQRAARARGIRPDGVRSPTHVPGLGVTAIASNGKPLVVGSRALMLRERVSVAVAEPQISDLESLGRSVMLVAVGGRLIGVAGLQDGLRPGARAAVQHLLDVGVEPVLLSGDARETCEAIGRALDIEHIRPEVLPTERGDEVARLADGGAVVAVIGSSPADDVALSAAGVSVAIGNAGGTSAEWSVQLASDDVRDAALALRLAHEGRHQARTGLGIAVIPAALSALAVALAVLPPAAAPLIALLGSAAAALRPKNSIGGGIA